MNITDEEIRIKVAEEMGWTVVQDEYGVCGTIDGIHWHSPAGFPNYPEDLNACAEFEKTLLAEHPDLRRVHRRILIEVCEGVNDYWRATARQRCLAYLKTKGILP